MQQLGKSILTRRRFDQLKSTARREEDDSTCTDSLSRFCFLRSADKSDLCSKSFKVIPELFEAPLREQPATGFTACVQISFWCHVSDSSQVGRLGIHWHRRRRLDQQHSR